MDRFINQIIQGDCLEVMKEMPDKSVDLILTDPPYNIGKAKWDKIDNYIEWMGEVFIQCQRVLKDNGSFYWFHNDMPQIAKLMLWLEENTSFVFKQMITWNKRFNEARNKGFVDGYVVVDGLRNYQQMAEYCMFYTFQDETGLTTVKLDMNNFTTLRQYFKDFQEALGVSLKQINKTLGHRKAEHAFYWGSSQWDLPTEETYKQLCELPLKYLFLRREYEDLRREYEDLRYTFNNQKTHHSVWNYEIAPKLGHITPKPVPLIENIIKHSSNEGDFILDPFGGSGTTAVASRNLGRLFCCIEKEGEYCNIARERVAKADKTGMLFAV